MKITYRNKVGETARIIPGGVVIRGKFGNRTIPVPMPQDCKDSAFLVCERYLVQLGFKRPRMWQCITQTCVRVAVHNGCIVKSKTDPSGTCVPYKDDNTVPHSIVKFKPWRPGLN